MATAVIAEFCKLGVSCIAMGADLAVFRLAIRWDVSLRCLGLGFFTAPLLRGVVLVLGCALACSHPAGTVMGQTAMGADHQIIAILKSLFAYRAGQPFVK